MQRQNSQNSIWCMNINVYRVIQGGWYSWYSQKTGLSIVLKFGYWQKRWYSIDLNFFLDLRCCLFFKKVLSTLIYQILYPVYCIVFQSIVALRIFFHDTFLNLSLPVFKKLIIFFYFLPKHHQNFKQKGTIHYFPL